MKLNTDLLKLSDTDFAAIINKKVSDYQYANPDTVIVRLDNEDAYLPFPNCVHSAMQAALEESLNDPQLRCTPPLRGYPFLIDTIIAHYAEKNIQLFDTEIFINDGAKCDVSGLTELFDGDNTVMITEPFDSVYYHSSLSSGKAVRFVRASEKNGLIPLPPKNERADIIYLCSPCNPTGALYPTEVLKEWVDHALENNSLIIYDASYEDFACMEPNHKSIYSIEGAKKCTVQVCSLSKAAGFANLRLGYTIIPNNIVIDSTRLNQLWLHRERLKFNGVSYVTQRGAQAAFSKEGKEEIEMHVKHYLSNTRLLTEVLVKAGLCDQSFVASPNVWFKCPQNMSSWECFDYILKNTGVVTIPGSIFGSAGEGHMKLTGYTTRENASVAARRLWQLLGSSSETGAVN